MGLARATLDRLPLDVAYQFDHWQRRGHHHGLHTPRETAAMARYDALGCVFVHVAKAAGTSVSRALFDTASFGHKTVPGYKRILGPIEYYRRFSFAFVRDPYTRLVSAYTFLSNGGVNERDERFAAEHLAGLDSFEAFVLDWLTPATMKLTPHFRLQTASVCDRFTHGAPPKVGVSFLGRFEHVERDFAHVAERLGLRCPDGEPLRLPHDNRTDRRRDPGDFYTPEVRARVAELYRPDFDILGYSVS